VNKPLIRFLVLLFLIDLAYLTGELVVTDSLAGTTAPLQPPQRHLLNSFVRMTGKPAPGLAAGILVTALFHSSGFTTTLVERSADQTSRTGDHLLSMEESTWIIAGANIGTTVTALFAALLYWRLRREFIPALTAANGHVLFNVFSASLLLVGRFVASTSAALADWLPRIPNWTGLTQLLKTAGANLIVTSIQRSVTDSSWAADLTIGAGVSLIAVSLVALPCAIHEFALHKEASASFARGLNRFNTAALVAIGIVATGLLQSSSVFSSIVVVLAALSRIDAEQALALIVGSNLGTAVVPLAIALSGGGPGRAVALINFELNFVPLLAYSLIPGLWRFMRKVSDWLARQAAPGDDRSPSYVILAILGFYYAVPAVLLVVFG
jgi:sodium-dependent phosphate cotransporter